MNENQRKAIFATLQEAPEDLKSMRRVAAGVETEDAQDKWMAAWRDRSPGAFSEARNRAEDRYRKEQAYRMGLAEEREERRSGGDQGEDEGTERAIEMAEEWLRAQGDEA